MPMIHFTLRKKFVNKTVTDLSQLVHGYSRNYSLFLYFCSRRYSTLFYDSLFTNIPPGEIINNCLSNLCDDNETSSNMPKHGFFKYA